MSRSRWRWNWRTPPTPKKRRRRRRSTGNYSRCSKHSKSAPTATPVPGWQASWFIGTGAQVAEVDIYGDAFQKREPEWLGTDTVLEEFEGRTAGRVREYLSAIAAFSKSKPETLCAWIL